MEFAQSAPSQTGDGPTNSVSYSEFQTVSEELAKTLREDILKPVVMAQYEQGETLGLPDLTGDTNYDWEVGGFDDLDGLGHLGWNDGPNHLEMGAPSSEIEPSQYREPTHSEHIFETNGFEARLEFDEEHISEFAYEEIPITGKAFATYAADIEGLGQSVVQLWEETFENTEQEGMVNRYREAIATLDFAHLPPALRGVGGRLAAYVEQTVGADQQTYHHIDPADPPLTAEVIENKLDWLTKQRQQVVTNPTLDLITEAGRQLDLHLLIDIFNESRGDVRSGTSNLSPLLRAESVEVPYNDGTIAVLSPETEETRFSSSLGVVVGFDDTPQGVFAHAIDVSQLPADTRPTHSDVREVMGFDREIDPHHQPQELDASTGERIRLQGDLRVERIGDTEAVRRKIVKERQRTAIAEIINDRLAEITVPVDKLPAKITPVSASRIFDVTCSADGTIEFESGDQSKRTILQGLLEIQFALDVSPVARREDISDVAYVPPVRQWTESSLTADAGPIARATREVRAALRNTVSQHTDRLERAKRTAQSDIDERLATASQVNLPIDNHLVIVGDAWVPEVETEPVPVIVPRRSTLHVEHDEHNTITFQFGPGVYRFSLLPRGAR